MAMDVKLVLEQGGKCQTFRLLPGETIIGRRLGCKLRIPSESVSRRHCRIILRDDYVRVEDLASVNGTKVNGQLIAKPTIVHPGDRLTVGEFTFLVQYQLTPKSIEHLLDEQQREAELLPRFDANESSLPIPLESNQLLLGDSEELQLPRKKTKPVAAQGEQPDQKPDASMILSGRNWKLPSGKDIRDVLSELDKDEDD